MSHIQKTGLVLSGGGARGIAHLGILKVLDECGIKPTVISGTSSGAIMGAFYAAGYPVEEILEIVKKNTIFHLRDFAWSKSGLLTSKANETMYRKYFNRKTFDDLTIPLFISATDILNGKTVFYSSGDLVKAILASSALPVVFKPVQYKKRLLVDGSAISCLPVEPLVNKCTILIGSYVNPIGKIKTLSGMGNIFDRGLHLTLYTDVELKKKYFNLFIEPPKLVNYSMFAFKKADELFDVGYSYASKLKTEILKLKGEVNL